tara:strand:+ start:504 stop:1499 length:996 start_codon:yes stop_codon:yes gene_type:complete
MSLSIAVLLISYNVVSGENSLEHDNSGLIAHDCCSWFKWSDDSKSIITLDERDNLVGAWQLQLQTGGIRFIGANPIVRSPLGTRTIEYLDSGRNIRINNAQEGPYYLWSVYNSLRFSADDTKIAYAVTYPSGGIRMFDMSTVYIANSDGSDRKSILRLIGRPLGWTADGKSLLIVGKESKTSSTQVWRYWPSSDRLDVLLSLSDLALIELSPRYNQLIYIRAPQSDPFFAGPWLYDMDTGAHTRLGFTGSFRWQPNGKGILFIPARESRNDEHQVYWLPFNTGKVNRLQLLNGASKFKIDSFMWELSPDADTLAYVEQDSGDLRTVRLRWP